MLSTPVAHPHHAAFVFVLAKGLQRRTGGQSSRTVVMKSNLMIAPLGANSTLRFAGRWQLIVALVPRSPLTALAPRLPESARTFTDRRLLDRTLQQFLEMLLQDSSEVSRGEEIALERVISELCGAVLRDRSAPAGEDSRRDRLRGRAMTFIAEHCSDPELSPARVAREVNSSLRLLQEVFSEAGNGVAGAIRRERAHLARSRLIDFRYDAVSIEQIARSSGFSSPMSLRRALATAYGATPRALRKRHPEA
ncbi:helix-turn-helix domain-containing protein [Microbacterium sp. W4I20]|uniref:helix-turn-helix domain-containing protein n=1 Tax=Microbacterium sp. W4I20 TaxID=3042262 RepID=UPI0027D7C53F|nr:helix-turn-helix domain-containing protein [Microbacterium sp. W4I20]